MLFWCSVFSHKRIRKYIEILFHALSIHFIVGAVNSAVVQNSGTLFSPLPICTLVITLIDCWDQSGFSPYFSFPSTRDITFYYAACPTLYPKKRETNSLPFPSGYARVYFQLKVAQCNMREMNTWEIIRSALNLHATKKEVYPFSLLLRYGQRTWSYFQTLPFFPFAPFWPFISFALTCWDNFQESKEGPPFWRIALLFCLPSTYYFSQIWYPEIEEGRRRGKIPSAWLTP